MNKCTPIGSAACVVLAFASLAGLTPVASAATSDVDQRNLSLQGLASQGLVLLGPVERADKSQKQFVVLGQAIGLSWIGGQFDPDKLIGRLAAIYGSIQQDGSLKITAVEVLDHDFVPGATELFFKGIVVSVNEADGALRIGTKQVDYTGALHSLPADQIQSGAIVSLSGLQYSTDGKFYADNGVISQGASVKPDYQVGSGANVKPGYQVGSGASVRSDYQVGSGASVKPDYQVGSGASVKPDYQVGSGASVKPDYQVGSGASVKPGYQVGSGASVKPNYQVGSGASVKPGYQVGSGASVKPDYQVGSGASVKPGYQVGSGSSVKPGYQVGSGSSVKPDYQVGSGASVKPGYQVGSGAG